MLVVLFSSRLKVGLGWRAKLARVDVDGDGNLERMFVGHGGEEAVGWCGGVVERCFVVVSWWWRVVVWGSSGVGRHCCDDLRVNLVILANFTLQLDIE